MDEQKVELFRNWSENLEDNLVKLGELNYIDLYRYYSDIYTMICFDSDSMSEEELTVKYGINGIDLNRIKSVKHNINSDGSMKGQKWTIIDEDKIKNWLINPEDTTFEALCFELERSGVAVESKCHYLLEKELYLYTGDINEFCKKYNINMLTYHIVTNRSAKAKKKNTMIEDNTNTNDNKNDNTNDNTNEDNNNASTEKESDNFLQQKWTPDEEKFFKVLLKNGKNEKEIIKLLKRSSDDIEQRKRIFLYREFEDWINTNSKNYKITPDKVISACIYQMKRMNEKKKIEVVNSGDMKTEDMKSEDIPPSMPKKSLFSSVN